MKKNETEKNPEKKFVGYLAASTSSPYTPNCYSYTHFKKTLTEECKTKDISNWRKINLKEDK